MEEDVLDDNEEKEGDEEEDEDGEKVEEEVLEEVLEEGEEEEEESDVVRELLSKHSACLGMWKKLFQYNLIPDIHSDRFLE